MPKNIVLTGPPQVGKTTVLQRVGDRLAEIGHEVGGVYCPECQVNGERIGIDLVDAMSGDFRTLAHINREAGPKIGDYRVDVAAVEEMYEAAFERGLADADCIILDEIAPMQLECASFPGAVRSVLNDSIPVLASIAAAPTDGVIGEIKRRDDCEMIRMTEAERDRLPIDLAADLAVLIEGH
ncbi:nucleoside-triphosphatase [Halocatena halophila]|uniref:nucleoside-triphosphatase n=1 Tax=Halocatena halophila TaxID=2814576 RepID=UPI002ED2A3DC